MQQDILILDFGKHRGKHISQVGDAYLGWLVKTFSETHRWWKPAADALTWRRTTKQQSVQLHALFCDLKSCTRKTDLQKGRRLHANAVETGIVSDIYMTAALISMYAKCGSMLEAKKVFDGLQKPDVVAWTALILGYADNGQGLAALDTFFRMKASGCARNSVTYVGVLKACASLAAHGGKEGYLERAKEIHLEIGCHMNQYVQSTLIDMYAKLGSMVDAKAVFDGMQAPNVVAWNALIMGYADNGQGQAALDLFSRMKSDSRCAVDSVTYIAALKACTLLGKGGDETAIELGRQIHLGIGCCMNHFVQSTLIEMYTKCGSMRDAKTVFDSIKEPDVVSWTALIQGYADNGQGFAALELFSRMKFKCRCAANSVTYVAVLKACTSLAAEADEPGKKWCLERGREIHTEIGCQMNHFVQSTLIDMYAKCGSMVDARRVFETIREPGLVSWTALIMGYADNGECLAGLGLFSRMKGECHCTPDSVTYVAALKACVSMGALSTGRRFHSEIRDFDAHAVACLIDFYANCGSMEEAREVFDLHPRARDTATWNALLAGYASFGDTLSVFSVFKAMQDQGFQANAVTFVCILGCCSHAGLVEKAREYLEAMPRQYGITPTVRHYTCVVDLLGRANRLEEALLELRAMPCDAHAVTWMTILGACHKWKNAEVGRLALESLLHLNQQDLSPYIRMAEIYGSRGMWEQQEKELKLAVPPHKLCHVKGMHCG